MFRRFERMLRRSEGEYGLILADSGRRADEEAAHIVVEGMGRSRTGRSAGHVGVINCVIHRDSRLDIMIQLADIAAYIIHKQCRGNPHFRRWFEAPRQGLTRTLRHWKPRDTGRVRASARPRPRQRHAAPASRRGRLHSVSRCGGRVRLGRKTAPLLTAQSQPVLGQGTTWH